MRHIFCPVWIYWRSSTDLHGSTQYQNFIKIRLMDFALKHEKKTDERREMVQVAALFENFQLKTLEIYLNLFTLYRALCFQDT